MEMSFAHLPRHEIYEQALEATQKNNVPFLQAASDWLERHQAEDLVHVAAEFGSVQSFTYLVEKLSTSKNRTASITSYLCHAVTFDQHEILEAFLKDVSQNIVSLSKIFSHVVRENAEKCFNTLLNLDGLPPSVIPTAFFALLHQKENANKGFIDKLYPRLDTYDLSSVLVSFFEQHHHSEKSLEFADDFVSNICDGHFDEIYPSIHRFTKEFPLPQVTARQSKRQLNKILSPTIDYKITSGASSSRRM